MSLSKSQYLKGLQCHKSLWLTKHKPKLATPISEATQFLFDQGATVGKAAQALFPNGTTIEFNSDDFAGMIIRTAELLSQNKNQIIYEATFKHEALFTMVDILVQANDSLEIYEVKSGTGVEEVHLNDLAFQVYILRSLGYKVSKASLIHINNKYVRASELDVQGLFTIEDFTLQINKRILDVPNQISEMNIMLSGAEPNIDIGPYCKKPYECDFKQHCWAHIPEISVFSLSNARGKDWELYEQGVVEYQDVPINSKLNPKHTQQIQAYLNNEESIDKPAISKFLESFELPISFLDFETFHEAIPSYQGTNPYEQIPFQYSLHVLRSADDEPEHYEFLADAGIDPRQAFIESLLSNLPKTGSVVVYNQSFETKVLEKLAIAFPHYQESTNNIISRFVDPMVIFRSRWYYHGDFHGSYSIKKVLPVLVPELSYEALEIAEGTSAARSYHLIAKASADDVLRLKAGLLEYCKLDTLAMVEIYKALDRMILNKEN